METIREFARGKLDGDSLHQVESHISECAACCTVLAAIPDDNLAELLRSLPSEKPNLRLVPGYEISEELGRGGMGIVYLATQPLLRRQVALKMISRGEQANSQELARFRREGQAIAALQHPHIAQVYEVGEQAGQPYISMELVRGGTLSRFLRDGPLSMDVVTRLLILLTEAVVHAHSRGVIHRDLKPSNILLAQTENTAHAKEQPCLLNPKIVDFGLAKRSGSQETATTTGMLVGTPSYMSPEQAAGKNDVVTELTDVYGLGTILYETLVGRPPFQGASPVEILEQVRTLEPVRPRSMRPDLPVDLETICLKCLEKSPSRRYQSASCLLDDLNRFSSGRPILAKPSGWSTRLLKWTKRHPAATSLVCVLGLAMVGLLTVSLIYNHYLSEALKGAREQRERADANSTFALDAVETMLERVGFSELANQPGMEIVRENLLLDAVKFYSSLLEEQPADNADARKQFCVALAKLGRLQSMLGHIEEGSVCLKRAIDLQLQLVAEFPKRPDIRHELATSYIYLGLLDKWKADEFQSAIELLEPIQDEYPICRSELAEAMNLVSNTLPPEKGLQFHLNVLAIRRSLHQAAPQDETLRHGLGQTLHNLGHTHFRLGHSADAVRVVDEALEIFDQLVVEHGEVTGYQESLAECTSTLAAIEHDNGRFDRSRTLIERSTSIRRLLVERFPKTPAFAESLARSNLTGSAFLIQLQSFSAAADQAGLAVEIAERLNREHPSREYQFLVTSSLSLLATAMNADNQAEQSHAIFERACAAYEDLLTQAPENLGYITEAGVHYMNFSNLLRSRNPGRALECNDRAVDLLERAYSEQPTRADFQSYLFNAQGARAQTQELLGHYLLAVESWDRAVQLSRGERIREMKIARALALARAERTQQATRAATELVDMQDHSGEELYNLACLYGLIAKADTNNPSHCDRAFELLVLPACIEFLSIPSNLEQLKVDSDLDVIRTDERFDQFLAKLVSQFKKSAEF